MGVLRVPGVTLRYVPLRLGAWFRRLGISQVRELDWWESVQHPGSQVSVAMTPAQVCAFSPAAASRGP